MRILVVDDHQMLREGLKVLLSGEPDFEVVGEAENGRVAVEMVRTLLPDIVVMDLRMDDLNGIEATRQVVALHTGAKVICLSAHADEETAAEVIRAGASGFILKVAAFSELILGIRAAASGKMYLSPTIAGLVLDGLTSGRGSANESVFASLSSREREVLQLIGEGHALKDIALQLHVSVKTIETHRRNIMEKLHVDSTAGLIKYAVRHGLASL